MVAMEARYAHNKESEHKDRLYCFRSEHVIYLKISTSVELCSFVFDVSTSSPVTLSHMKAVRTVPIRGLQSAKYEVASPSCRNCCTHAYIVASRENQMIQKSSGDNFAWIGEAEKPHGIASQNVRRDEKGVQREGR